MTHRFRAWPLTVLAVLAACSSPVTPTLLPTTGGNASMSPGASMSNGLPTNSLPPTATPMPTPTPLVMISHESDDETVELEVPAPLIPPGVTIAVEDHPLQDAPRDVRDAGVRQAFHVLTPIDLTFTQPVRVTVTMPRAALTRPDGKLALVVPAMRTPAGQWDWLAESVFTADADTVEVSGLTTHLGWLFLWSDLTDVDAVAATVSPQPVDQPFRLLLGIQPQQPRPNPIDFAGTTEFNVDAAPVLTAERARGGPITLYPTVYVDATCDTTGNYTLTVVMQLQNFGADTPFLTDTLSLPPTAFTLNYVFTGVCVLPAPTAPPATASPTPSGTIPSPSASPTATPSTSPSANPSASASPSPTPSPTPKSKPTRSP